MEAVHLIRKGRVRRVAKHDSLAQGTIHFHLVWRGNLTQTSDFALLLGGILLIKDFRNETQLGAAHRSCWSPGISGRTSFRAGFGISYDQFYNNLATNENPSYLSG